MTFFHGIHVSEPVTGVRPILEKSLAVIGLLATATAAAGAPPQRSTQPSRSTARC